ncbi:MAG TPA: 4,5-DOPA dioxygenase extradiol [Burkholderiaceae bacterium]|nr:4,5-DOPA dioxygenase extradiol [Burkholderiaceae bacterium]
MDQFTTMPAAFIGHGSPMNTLENNRFTATWRALGQALPTPRAVLAISAHWFINGSAVTAMQQPRVIHDFYGFPKELFEFNYPAPGAPDVAAEIAALVRPEFVALDRDSWGLDHGTWSVLSHVFPKADVPVVQLSVHAGEDIRYHFELGVRLAPLRERGIFIIGSGNVVHNLRRVDWHLADQTYDWAQNFDSQVRQIMTTRPEDLLNVVSHTAYAAAVPTPEHFLPLAYLAGLSAAAGKPADVLVEGGTMGAITMTSFVLGCQSIQVPELTVTGAPLPDPTDIPPEHTNT